MAAVNLLLPVSILAWMDAAVHPTRDRIGKWLVAAFCFVLVAGAYFDYLLFRLMGTHLLTGLRVMTEGGLRQFLLTAEATGISKWTLSKGFGMLCLLATVGAFLVRGLRLLSDRRPLKISSRAYYLGILSVALLTFGVEYIALRSDTLRYATQEMKRVMPFYVGLWQSSPGVKYTGARLRPLRTVVETESALTNVIVPNGPRPDIFLFIVESARGDYLDVRTTPNLAKLRMESLVFPDSLANANATHLSTYALLAANYPLYFAIDARTRSHAGSVPLRLFQKLGYAIHVLAANYMNYHDLDKMLFGPRLETLASLTDARKMEELDRPDRDRNITRALIRRLDDPSGGRLFLIFYESTHHDYFWPSDMAPPFTPFAPSWDYVNFHISAAELEGIKNRYRNALHFIDGLFGEVVSKLKTTRQYEDAVILVTGDHGEEFLEHGKMVHASETCRAQTHVPIYLKLPRNAVPGLRTDRLLPAASHLDLLPTLLDYLGVHGTNLYDGQSLFRKRHDPVLMVEENGARDPYQLCIQVGKQKAWFQYRQNGVPIALESSVYLQKVTDSNDQFLPVDPATTKGRQFVRDTFGDALKEIFPEIEL